MSYAPVMEKGFPRLDHAHTVRKGGLVETTPEVNREVAESAMLLSQGARRAIAMKRKASNEGTIPSGSAAIAATSQART